MFALTCARICMPLLDSFWCAAGLADICPAHVHTEHAGSQVALSPTRPLQGGVLDHPHCSQGVLPGLLLHIVDAGVSQHLFVLPD